MIGTINAREAKHHRRYIDSIISIRWTDASFVSHGLKVLFRVQQPIIKLIRCLPNPEIANGAREKFLDLDYDFEYVPNIYRIVSRSSGTL